MRDEKALLRTPIGQYFVRTPPTVRLQLSDESPMRGATGLKAQRGSHRLGFCTKEQSAGGRNLTPLRSREYFVFILPTMQPIGFQTRNALVTSQGLMLG
jgi:hypothetical protein